MELLNVLIVDDESELRKSVASILKNTLPDLDFSFDEAATGTEALNLVRAGSYDLVLMDVKMPEMDGLEALTKIKDHDPRTFVVLITAHANLQDAVLSIKEGAYDYLEAPLYLLLLLLGGQHLNFEGPNLSFKLLFPRKQPFSFSLLGIALLGLLLAVGLVFFRNDARRIEPEKGTRKVVWGLHVRRRYIHSVFPHTIHMLFVFIHVHRIQGIVVIQRHQRTLIVQACLQ